MFVTVKNLTRMIDSEIRYVNEAKQSHVNVSEDEYQEYLLKMKSSLFGRLRVLKEISSNDRLISKYEKIITEIFQ